MSDPLTETPERWQRLRECHEFQQNLIAVAKASGVILVQYHELSDTFEVATGPPMAEVWDMAVNRVVTKDLAKAVEALALVL